MTLINLQCTISVEMKFPSDFWREKEESISSRTSSYQKAVNAELARPAIGQSLHIPSRPFAASGPSLLPGRALLTWLVSPPIFIRSSPSSWQSVSFILFSDHSASATGSLWITCPFRSRCRRGFSMEFVGGRTFCKASSRRQQLRMSVPSPYLSTVKYPFNF